MRKIQTLLFFFTFGVGNPASAQCIAVVTSGVTHFWSEVIAGAQQAAKEIGITVYARGAFNDDDSNSQHHIINQAIYTEKCQGLLLAPNSNDRLKEVELLKQQGIPTVYIDRDLGGARVSVIKTNNVHAGRLAGQAMIKALRGKGNIAVSGFKKGILTTDIRQAAFIKITKQAGHTVKVIDYLSTRVGEARVSAFDTLNNINNIDAIFTANEVTTVATLLALRKMKKLGKVVHIGFDGHKLIIDSTINLDLHGFVLQDDFQMGYQGVLTLHKAMLGEKVSEYITTNSIYIDSNNINHIDIKRALKAYQK